MIVVVVISSVPPRPVLFLLVVTQLTEIAMGIAMGFDRPLVVEDNFVVISSVVVMVIGIVHTIVVMLRAPGRGKRHGQSDG